MPADVTLAETTVPRDPAELLRHRTAAGFRWLLESVAPTVKGLLMRKFSSSGEDAIEDAIVEAAERLWLEGEPYDAARSTPTQWLYTAAVRQLVDRHRFEQARPLIVSIGSQDLAELATAPSDSRSDERARVLEDLRACIAQLSPREQEVIYASLEGFSGPDSALGEQLGTSDNTVRVLRSRAHKKLYGLMQLRRCRDGDT